MASPFLIVFSTLRYNYCYYKYLLNCSFVILLPFSDYQQFTICLHLGFWDPLLFKFDPLSAVKTQLAQSEANIALHLA